MLCPNLFLACLELCFGIFTYDSNFSHDQVAMLSLFYFLSFYGVTIIFIYIVVTKSYSV